jgi:DNA mismatch repair protein MutS
VLARAREILGGLENDELTRGGRPSLSAAHPENQQQLGLFGASLAADHPALRRLRELDPNRLTPLEALALLAELKRESGE